MRDQEILNSEAAAALLDFQPSTIRTLARRGAIPGKKLGREWRFVKTDLLAWMRSKGSRGWQKPPPWGAAAFLQRVREDSEFRLTVESLETDTERMALVRKAGFGFTLEELEEAVKAELADEAPEPPQEPAAGRHVLRQAQRYQVYLTVSELNGKPVDDTVILDISAWGARLGAFIPFGDPGTIKITFTPPGETKNVRLAGKVVWSRLMTSAGQYQAGMQFLKPLHELHREGKI